MLLLAVENIDGIFIDVNLEQVCFINPVDLNRQNKNKPDYKPKWDKDTCGLVMTNGIVLHVKKSASSVRQAMMNYRGGK